MSDDPGNVTPLWMRNAGKFAGNIPLWMMQLGIGGAKVDSGDSTSTAAMSAAANTAAAAGWSHPMVTSREKPRDKPIVNPDYYCSKCDRAFASKLGFQNHMLSHEGKFKFWCDQCKKGYQDSKNYKQHVWRHEGKTFNCKLCDRKFNTQANLKYHQSEHSGVYMYNCKFCMKGFNNKTFWVDHENRHAGIKFSCRICGKEFNHENFRNNHEKNEHVSKVAE